MIYLDNAATTQPLPSAEEAVFMANPSSPHGGGIAAERALADARSQVAALLRAAPEELVFTSGGTEGNNLAILGFVLARKKNDALPLLLAEPWAHPSVLAPVQYAADMGWATAQLTPTEEWPQLAAAADTVLACANHVHHETGDITDLPALRRELLSANANAVLFADGAQGFGKTDEAAYAAADMYALSGHKCHAPTGIGALMVRKGIKLAPLLRGGGQEHGLRAGTQNTFAACELARAASLTHANREKFTLYVSRLRDMMADLSRDMADFCINARTAQTSPYILNASFLGTRGEVLVHMLSEQHIYVSMGAACKSRSKKDTSSLALMGVDRARAESAVRFSFSHRTTPADVVTTKKALIACVAQLRKISGY